MYIIYFISNLKHILVNSSVNYRNDFLMVSIFLCVVCLQILRYIVKYGLQKI